MLQLAAYANYLDFGLQTAIARFLAGALEKRDEEQSNQLLSNAFAILSAAGGLALGVVGILTSQIGHIFHSIPAGLSGEIGYGVLILGISTALGMPLSAYTGVLIGMQRNEFPAMVIAASRLLGAVAVVVVAQHTHSLAWLAACIAVSNLLAGVVQYVIVQKLLPWLRCRRVHLKRAMMRELVRYCSTLSVWSFAMLLVSGLDVTIVGLFRFQAVGAYSIAATLVMFYTGLLAAAFSAMMAPVAILQARKEYHRISELVVVTTRLNSYVSMAAIVTVFLFGAVFIRVWVGPAYLAITLPVMTILLFAQAIRTVGNAYGTALVGMGLQKMGILPAILEALANLLLSVLGVIWIGPTGVAWATLTAAVLALGIVIFYVLPRIRELRLNGVSFIWQGAGVPFAPFALFCFWMACRGWIDAHLPRVATVRWIPYSLLLAAIVLSYNGVRCTLRRMRSI